MAEGNYILDIELSKNGEFFTIKNIGETPIPSGDYVIIISSSNGFNGNYTLKSTDNLNDGINIYLSDTFNNTAGSIYPDGLYYFKVFNTYDTENPIVTAIEGFLFNITNKVMIDSLTYRDTNDSYKRYIMIEKIRLLENLYYSAHLGLTDAFVENLETLQKLV